MDLPRPLDPSWRAAAVALAASAAFHGAALVGVRIPGAGDADLEPHAYEAKLEPAAAELAPPPSAPPPAPRPRARKSEPRPGETVALLPAAIEAEALAPLEPAAPPEPAPEVVALAQPPSLYVPPDLPPFRPDALPAELTIHYALTSSFADGEASYSWKRDGDRYEITGTAQATGFFTLFLEGRIDQTATGRVTPGGLKPDRFTERRGETPEEGLAFDWEAGRVEFRRGEATRAGPLTDTTVDWLSMIFQLAHQPPAGEKVELRVYTQRRLYQYRLKVLGMEEIDLPFGRARTLHLRHAGDRPEEAVDVWLGVDQHYLPVKLRYPVARNRLVVEQTATSVRAR
jgi:hypothetical protein